MASFPRGGPPKGYVPGLGRGALGFTTRSDVGPAAAASAAEGTGSRSAEARAARDKNNEKAVIAGQYDDEDDEADRIWAAVDEKMNRKRKRKEQQDTVEDDTRSKIAVQFRELKEQLGAVSEDQWDSIPDNAGDFSLKYKQQRRRDIFTPLSDSLLEQQSKANLDATAGNAAISATTAAADASVVPMSGLSAARGTVLGMSLDKADTSGTQTTVDPQGYLTSLAGTQIATSAEIGDIKKARLLLKSVRDTNPKHGPAWIASARVEEAAGKILQARKLIQEGCQTCPDSEDVWLEAARLHPPEVGKSILATAVRRIPTSVKIFIAAADLEQSDSAKRAVFRKALEANPTSVTLWKAAIELEDADDARVLLALAVEKIPQSVDMWLALARLETYENAQKVLNKARKALPSERSIWLAAAKLEESQNHDDIVEKVVDRAVKSLRKNEAIVTRDQWLQEAEAAESAGFVKTSAAIVKHTIGLNVDEEDRQRTWSEDAKAAVSRGSIATARAILSHALAVFPTKRSFWMQAVELERKHGTAKALDEVLAAASERLPRVELFWLLRAKELWLAGDVDKSREVLTAAFAANPDSEAVWLAAVKLEWENGEIERARVLLERARERAPTDRVYMKSALFEREQKKFADALNLIEEGISKYPKFAKFYMMGGQICSEDLPQEKSSLDRARKFYQRGLQECPNNTVLWSLASRLEENASAFDSSKGSNPAAGFTKARGLLDLGRLKNPKNPELWLESVRLERRAGNGKLADTLMARALQECPSSGLLLADNIRTAPRAEQKSKSADAIKRCPDDPRVIAAVASLFASERKNDKARKWFDRAVILNPDLGDSWARYFAFELKVGSKEQQESVKERCLAAEPKHGEIWTSIAKDMSNRGKSTSDLLDLAAKRVSQQGTDQLLAN